MRQAVAVFLPIASERARVALCLQPMAIAVTLCATQEAAIDALVAIPAAAALSTSMRDEAGHDTTPFVRWVHARFPTVPIVAFGALSPQFLRDVLPAIRCGLHAVALRDYDDVGVTLAEVLRATRRRTVAEHACAAVDGRLSAATRPIVQQCVQRAYEALRVEQVAADLGVTRKTLAIRLAAERLPAAGEIIGWGRVLQATRLLEDQGRSVEQVAFALSFDSGTALRHMLPRSSTPPSSGT